MEAVRGDEKQSIPHRKPVILKKEERSFVYLTTISNLDCKKALNQKFILILLKITLSI